MRLLAALVALSVSVSAEAQEATGSSEAPLRPTARPDTLSETPQDRARMSAFQAYLDAFRGRALVQGVTPETFDAALDGVVYDGRVVARDRDQAEFVRPVWTYLDAAVSDSRIADGRAALEENARLLDAIESRYGVEKEILAAIWGIETAYGRTRGGTDVIAALATLAFDARRGAFFETQLVAALRVLQLGDVAREAMVGSWAGAMGHTQFIPTSYLAFAVDFDGDGRRDIWGANPADALASTASYLKRHGWVQGQPWGIEVRLSEDFNYTLARREDRRPVAEWAELGVEAIGGGPLDDHGAASLLVPAGARGPAFLVFDNFEVIERYNAAEAYVLAVGHLSDRLAGGEPFLQDWPRSDRALTEDERRELQERLTDAGFSTRGVDGRIGPNTLAAIRQFQSARGLVPDGYPSLSLLEELR